MKTSPIYKLCFISILIMSFAGCSSNDDNNPEPESSIGCFNPDMLKTGTHIELVHLLSGAEGNGLVTGESETKGPTQFRGHDAIETYVIMSYPDGNIERRYSEYVTFVPPGQWIHYGTSGEEGESWSEPPLMRRFDMKPGESHEQTFTSKNSYSNSQNTTYEKVTYLGRETIDVPAGRFENTCKSVINTSTQASTGVKETTRTEWLAAGSGVLLRADIVYDDAGGGQSELVSPTINGESISP